MNPNYIAQALCYHGQPMQKIWEDERSVEDLRSMGLAQPNYSVYQERQKFFTFQERAKRLKVHQFLARKAVDLYNKDLVANVMEDAVLQLGKETFVAQPPYEYFLTMKDQTKGWLYRLATLKPGGLIFASVQKTNYRIVVKPLCTDLPLNFYLEDIPIKAAISNEHRGPLPLDKDGVPRNYEYKDIIRCEILDISIHVQRLTLGMTGIMHKGSDVKFGLCDITDLPRYYRQINMLEEVPHYEDHLMQSLEIDNPNLDALFQANGLQPNENLSMMNYLKVGFPDAECAAGLRQKQASNWAFRSVADGVEHFKNGEQVEAFQCLNKALKIDPRNVEGLVARGALYANRGSFLKAIEDFEKALTLNKYHVNARKYIGETLVALGRNYEEEKRIPDAIKAYTDCLKLLPQHEQARQSLDALQRPHIPPPMVPHLYTESYNTRPNDTTTTTTISSSTSSAIAPKTQSIQSQSDDSSSSGSESNSDEQQRNIQHKPRNNSTGADAGVKYNQPYYAMAPDKMAVSDAQKANEFRLDEDDTLSSVRKLIHDASKHKKAKKKSKKKKDKERGKDKEKEKEKKAKKVSDLSDIEMLKKINFSEAFKLMNDSELKAGFQKYLVQTLAGHPPQPIPQQDVPPAPPSFKSNHHLTGPSTSRYATAATTTTSAATIATADDNEQPPPAPKLNEQQKLSFQIKKRDLQVDKFGMVRLAAPMGNQRSISRSRTRSRSPDRRRCEKGQQGTATTARRGFRGSRSRTRSRSRSPRYRRRRSRSRSRSRSHSRSRSPQRHGRFHNRGNFRYPYDKRRDRRSRSRSYGRPRSPSPPYRSRRRSPSPFMPRRSPSPASRYRRSRSWSRSPRRQRYGPRGGRGRGRYQSYGNRYVSRAVESPPERNTSNGHRDERRRSRDHRKSPSEDPDDGPTIEEIDEMIREAQKERKEDLLKQTKKTATPSGQ